MNKPNQEQEFISSRHHYSLVAGAVYHAALILLVWVGNFLGRRNSSASRTAQGPLFARWLQHQYGTRLDEPANRLMTVIPHVPRLGFRLVAGPLLLAHRVSGYVPPSFRYPFQEEITLQNQGTARQTFYDGVEDWLNQLINAGFDPNQPALFICEGVIPYLDQAAVHDTFRRIASTAQGTIVAFDYFTSEVLESGALLMRSIGASLNAGGESLKFGVDSTPPLRDRVAELLQPCGLTLIEQHTPGQETAGKRA